MLLDADLAELYGVETKVLLQAEERNRERFPEDFMFQLTVDEFGNLRSQFVISSWGGCRYVPYIFTEQRGGDALVGAQDPARNRGQYRGDAGIRAAKGDTFLEQGTGRETGRA